MPPPITASGQRRVLGLKQEIWKEFKEKTRPRDRVAAEHGERGKEGGGKGRHMLAPTDQAEQARSMGPESGPPEVSALPVVLS